jgi:Asp-tRNA(Asn)/Glu-tRNA(Gln) amidotransferase A subunit family amidase
LRNGDFTCAEVTSAFLQRIEVCNPALHALITVNAEQARRDAAVWDTIDHERRVRVALLGVPFAVKDLIDVAGVPTTGGSPVMFDDVADTDAVAVASLRSAGAVSIGKANPGAGGQ